MKDHFYNNAFLLQCLVKKKQKRKDKQTRMGKSVEGIELRGAVFSFQKFHESCT